jgi:hypothetical protein
MTEDSNEAKQRLDLQEKRAKFARAAEKLAQLVKKYGEKGSATEGPDRNDRVPSEDVDMADGPRAHSEAPRASTTKDSGCSHRTPRHSGVTSWI